jgi:hypothetical protein
LTDAKLIPSSLSSQTERTAQHASGDAGAIGIPWRFVLVKAIWRRSDVLSTEQGKKALRILGNGNPRNSTGILTDVLG